MISFLLLLSGSTDLEPSVVVEWLTLLLRIVEIPVSIICLGYRLF
jgi:hypothetical protein